MEFTHTAHTAKKHKSKLLKIFNSVIDSGRFLNGDQNKKLEEKLIRLFRKGYITTTASGHDALVLSLRSLSLRTEDEILFPANSYPTTLAIANSSAKLVPVDVDENGQIDPKEIEKKMTKHTKVIVIVHLYGLIGDLESIINLAKKHNVFLLEDAAQSFGSTYKGKLTGTLGDIGCFSFYPTKNLGALGDGGAIWTKSKLLHQFFQQAKSYGEKRRYFSEFVSGHSRLGEFQAAVLNHYLKLFTKDKIKKQKLSQLFREYLKNVGQVRPLASNTKSQPNQHLFVIEADSRDELKKYLASKNIPTAIHYPFPIHLLPAFSSLQYKKGDFPMSERLSKRILSLPFHAYISEKDIAYIAKAIKGFYHA